MGSKPTELIAAELGSDWPSAAAHGRGRAGMIDCPGRGAGEAATGESAAAAGAVGLWLRQGSLFRRSLCARDRSAGAGCPEQPAGPGRAVPRQEALCERVDDSLPLVLPCLLLKLPAGGRTCGVGSDSFNVVLFLNTHTRRHTRTQAYFQARLWFVGFFFFF